MRAKILIRRKILARNVQEAMKKIRTKFPNARLVTSRFTETYAGSRVPDWSKRTMDVAFVDDADNVWD